MSTLLAAIESTGDVCGVAFFSDGELLLEEHVRIRRAHDRLLATLFSESLSRIGADRGDLDAVAVSIGPGSYTGIRIGISFAIGFCTARSIPIVPVSTLDAVAWGAIPMAMVGRRHRLISVIPAGRDGVYSALYEIEPTFRRLTRPHVVPPKEIAALLDENVFAAGPGISLLGEECEDCLALSTEELEARNVGGYGGRLLGAGQTVTPAQIEPMYITGVRTTRPTREAGFGGAKSVKRDEEVA